MAKPFEDEIHFQCRVPSIRRDSAIIILSEIGNDTKQFSSSRELSFWAGLTPMNNQFASKKSLSKFLVLEFILNLFSLSCACASKG